jgi:thiamine-phosphate diphosphorylase
VQIGFAVDAGIDVVQVRERDLDTGPLFHLVCDLVALARGSRTRIVVNDRLDVALAAGADGVHLREDSMPVAAVRRVAPVDFVVGRSVHTPEDASRIGRAADYLYAGTVWASASKPAGHPLLGRAGLERLARLAQVPVIAIGGVTADRLDQVTQAGAAGAAAIGLFMREPASADTTIACGAIPLHDLTRRAHV